MEWQNTLFETQPEFDHKVLAAYELILGVKFPNSYTDTVMLHQGQRPVKTLFDYNDISGPNTTVMGILFHFIENDPTYPDYNILKNYQDLEGILPKYVIPFSEDPGGFPIAFDFRTNKQHPSVVLIDNDSGNEEDTIITIAADFEKFMAALYEE